MTLCFSRLLSIVLNLRCGSHYLLVVLWIPSHQLGAHVSPIIVWLA
jgi:hypothetical protein